MREAIGELEQQGLIVSQPNRVKTVVSPTDDDLRHAYQVRTCLELLALHLLWDRITDDLLTQMRRLVTMMQEAAADPRLSPLARHGRLNVLDSRFHGLLVQATGNHVLLRAWNTASPWVLGFIRDLQQERSHTEGRVWPRPDPHEALLAALEQQDLASAERALLAHISTSWRHPADRDVAGEQAVERVSSLVQDIASST
mgnify:CR=1 FL=1